jgi:hypothetical protein
VARTDSTREREATLLALLEHEERMARWESVPTADREKLLDELARLLLRAAEEGGGDEQREAD